MKISILLPFKENFSPSYAGAVSLFINDTLKFSKYKKNITVYGYTEFKKKFSNDNKLYDVLSSLREKINAPTKRKK